LENKIKQNTPQHKTNKSFYTLTKATTLLKACLFMEEETGFCVFNRIQNTNK